MVIHTNPAPREDDEQSIRELIETWHHATARGDIPQLLKLMSEDVVFLVVGQLPMRGRDAFATGFQQALQHYRIEPSGKIQEIHTTEDWAYCWTNLSVTMVPLQSGSPIHRRETRSRFCTNKLMELGLLYVMPIYCRSNHQPLINQESLYV